MCCQHRYVVPQRQAIPKSVVEERPMPVQRIINQDLFPLRQKVLPPAKCQVCGYPLQVVHIAGKTTTRCSNSSCNG